MAQIVPFPLLLRDRSTSFSRRELGQILGLYSRRVAEGVWRDYAIDHRPGFAQFSVYRSTHDRPLFQLAKITQRPGHAPSKFRLMAGPRLLMESESLIEVLGELERRGGRLTAVAPGARL